MNSFSNEEKSKVALLRGVNVGSKNRLRMADLTECLAGAGLNDVRTYIQSGNICFTSRKTCTRLEALIHDSILNEFGFDVPVVVRERDYFIRLVEANPYLDSELPDIDVKQLYVILLQQEPSAAALESLPVLEASDQYQIIGDVVYLRIQGRFSDTKLTIAFFEKKLGVAATARNWKTICKIAEM